MLTLHSNDQNSIPVTVVAYNNVSESTLNATVYIQKAIRNLRTAPTAPTKYEDIGEIRYFIDDGTNVTVSIQSADMATPVVCGQNVLNGTCLIESLTHYSYAGEHCYNVTAQNLVSYAVTVHCHSVQHGIQDFQVVTSAPLFIPPETLFVTIDAQLAAAVNITVDFGDGSTLTYYFFDIMNRSNGDAYALTHEYQSPGEFLMTVWAENYVSNASYGLTIHAQYPVDPIEISASQQCFPLMQDTGSADIALELGYTGALKPTSVSINYTLTSVSETFSQTIADNESYPLLKHIRVFSFETFTITWYAYNMLSNKSQTVTVDVDQPITDLQIMPSVNSYGKVNESIPFEISLSWGSRVTFTVTFGDGEDSVYTSEEGGVNLAHAWTARAFYDVTVTAENTYGETSYTIPYTIQIVIPVEGFRLAARILNLMPSPLPNEAEVLIDVFIERGQDIPPDATVQIDFGDGKPVFEQPITDFLVQRYDANPKDTDAEKLGRTLTYFYTDSGAYTVTLHMWNVATETTQTVDIFIYEEISELQQMVKYTTAPLPPLGDGKAPNATFDQDHHNVDGEIYVPLDRATILTCLHATGTGVSYTWDFGDGEDSVIITDEARAAYWYQTPGVYTVSLNASNPVDWKQHSAMLVDVQVPVRGLQLIGNGPLQANQTFHFEIHADTLGTDVCYRADFKDTTTPINYIAFGGNEDSCRSQYASEINDAFVRFEEFDSFALWQRQEAGEDVFVNITNKFMSFATYVISVTGSNRVSTEESTIAQIVLKPDCYPPTVLLREHNQCQSDQACRNGHKQFMASQNVKVRSTITNKCKSSKKVWFKWNIYKVDTLGGEVLYNDKLPNRTTFEGASLRDITILAPVFEYGLYRFKVNVSMAEEENIFTLADTSIYITSSPLVAKIYGGFMITAAWGKIHSLDGSTGTYDPDKTGEAAKDGLEFTWLCRRYRYYKRSLNGTEVIDDVETFEAWNDDYTQKLENGTLNPLFVKPDFITAEDKHGCFGLSDSDDIPLPGGKCFL